MPLLSFVKKPAIKNVFARLLKGKSDVISGFKRTNPKPNRRLWDDFHDLNFEKFKSFTKKFVKQNHKSYTEKRNANSENLIIEKLLFNVCPLSF